MSVWNDYPQLSQADLRALVAVTAQVLLESDAGAADFSPDLLQQSTVTSARAIQTLLAQEGVDVRREQMQEILEDEDLATSVCREILDQVRIHTDLADRVAAAFEARKQKMTGIELVLLSGALVVLAMRIKRIKWGNSGTTIDFEPSGDAVKAFVTSLVKSVGGP
jgi:hypothetical protein